MLKSNLKFCSLLFLCFVLFFGCQKEEVTLAPTNTFERFKVPSINDAKSYFEANNKIPIINNSNGISLRTDEIEMTVNWDESSTKIYKEGSQSIPQRVDVLYTPINLNTKGNAKMFLASINNDGFIDSKYVVIFYTKPEDPKLFSGHVFIYDLEGKLELLSKYEEGNKVAVSSSNNYTARNDGDGGGGFTLGEILDFIGGDWFGLDGFIENDLVTVYWPEYTDIDQSGAGDSVNDSYWFNPSMHIPAVNGGGGSSGGDNSNDDDIDWWKPVDLFAHGLTISDAIEVDLSSIEADWLMNTASQEQLNGIANYLNNAEQIIGGGYNQSDIDFVIDILYYMMLNGNFNFDDIIQVREDLDMECQRDIIVNLTTMSSSSSLITFVQNTFFGNNEYNLQFEDVDLVSMQAQTLYPSGLVFNSGNYATIQFDNNFLSNGTDLAIVMIAAHEFVHLYLAYL